MFLADGRVWPESIYHHFIKYIIYIFYYYPLLVVLFLLITCRPSTPCATLATRTVTCAKKNFPQLSPTVLGAQVVDTSLVWRYLTVPTHGHRWARSYSCFLGWAHFHFDFIPFPPIVTAFHIRMNTKIAAIQTLPFPLQYICVVNLAWSSVWDLRNKLLLESFWNFLHLLPQMSTVFKVAGVKCVHAWTIWMTV